MCQRAFGELCLEKKDVELRRETQEGLWHVFNTLAIPCSRRLGDEPLRAALEPATGRPELPNLSTHWCYPAASAACANAANASDAAGHAATADAAIGAISADAWLGSIYSYLFII